MATGYGERERYVIGYDSEASNGAPFVLQFAHPDGRVELVPVNDDNVLPRFIDYIKDHTKDRRKERQYIVVGWNLAYEYTQLFDSIDPEAFRLSSFVIHDHPHGATCQERDDDGWTCKITALNEKRFMFTMEFPGAHRSPIKVIDGMAFVGGSLDNAAALLGLTRKLDKPTGLGTADPAVMLTDPEFLAYAEQDARITQQTGERIVAWHAEQDVPLAISAPQFAAYVFRRRYLDAEVEPCSEDLEDLGLASYHGGKNGFYLDAPADLTNAFDYDVNAAYTSAMMQLPNITEATWCETTTYEPGTHSLWWATVEYHACRYRSIQDRDGTWLTWQSNGRHVIAVTGYELDTAIALGELTIVSVRGYVMDGPNGGPLYDYCAFWYDRKRNAPTVEERLIAKLCLNSLYGKFIQKVPASDELIPTFTVSTQTFHDPAMVPGGYRAGGLYHPAIASLITGYVRALVHRYEHKYSALMTSTDGFLSLVPPDPADIGGHVGGLKVKVGRLRIWRERLYHFTEYDRCKAGCPTHPRGGRRHTVVALHGFRAGPGRLVRVPLRPGVYRYHGQVMVGLRQSLQSLRGTRYRPGTFVRLPFELDLTAVGARCPKLPP
jgi:hypothetical protein